MLPNINSPPKKIKITSKDERKSKLPYSASKSIPHKAVSKLKYQNYSTRLPGNRNYPPSKAARKSKLPNKANRTSKLPLPLPQSCKETNITKITNKAARK